MGQRFRVQLVGDETHEIEIQHRDLLLTERTLASNSMDTTGKAMPVHYVTTLIWAALVRLQLTSTKWRDFPDLLVDFDRLTQDGEAAGVDPTQPAAPTGEPST
jgi:hypothetical protein